MRRIFPIIALTVLACYTRTETRADASERDEGGIPVEQLIEIVLEQENSFERLPFSMVVRASTGMEVIPVEVDREADAAVLATIVKVADRILAEFGFAEHPVHSVGRINEVSRLFEQELMKALNQSTDLNCAIPTTAEGSEQRSGYPDLRIEHLESGRVFYLDPKVYRSGSERSSFRTFYFEPKLRTNKILEDASHMILGFSHSGRTDEGMWDFESWNLVDLADFKVRLKAEFQASNRDLYRDELVIMSSAPDGNQKKIE